MQTLEYKVSNTGNKLEVRTTAELKGSGIKKISDGSSHKRGLKGYQVTEKAFERLAEVYKTKFAG